MSQQDEISRTPEDELNDVAEGIRSPGESDRQHREKEAVILLKAGIREKLPWLDEEEIERRARRELVKLRKRHPGFDREYERTAPTSTAPRRATRNQHIELAAVLRLPVMRWWWDWMLRARGGRPAKRSLVLAVFCQMVFYFGKPDILNTLKDFQRSDMRDFIYGGLEGPTQSAVYRSMESTLKRRWPQVCRNINLSMFWELIDQKKPDGSLRHPHAGRYLVVDGMVLEAHVQQRPARYVKGADGVARPDDEHEAFLRGSRRMATWNGHKDVRGYKLCLISDLATGLPLMFRLYPNTVDEREACSDLLERLFKLWPECPAEYLIGDALYDDSKEFTREVELRWKLHPVFPPAGDYDRKLPYVQGNLDQKGEMGVPTCRHGHMRLRGAEEFCDAKAALERDESGNLLYPRGTMAPPQFRARLRWECAAGDKKCAPAETSPRQDARVYTYLPRAGSSKRAALRQVLQVRRNSIECIFSQLRGNGQAGPKQWRAFWAEDQEMEWLLYATLMFQTARRLVAETGRYDEVYEEAEALGLIGDGPSRLSDLEHKRMMRARGEGDLQAPPKWVIDDYVEGGYYHGCHDQAA